MKILKRIIVFIIICFIFYVIIYGLLCEPTYEYECIDMFGNTVYCSYISETRAGIYGRLADGTKIQITSYKRIEKGDY